MRNSLYLMMVTLVLAGCGQEHSGETKSVGSAVRVSKKITGVKYIEAPTDPSNVRAMTKTVEEALKKVLTFRKTAKDFDEALDEAATGFHYYSSIINERAFKLSNLSSELYRISAPASKYDLQQQAIKELVSEGKLDSELIEVMQKIFGKVSTIDGSTPDRIPNHFLFPTK